MQRFPPELDRLYGLGTAARTEAAHAIRAAVLAVRLPAGWERLSAVWRGVQSDLDLPAPAIAVSGVDALQLWFSFASPMPSPTIERFLEGLRERYLADVKPAHVALFAQAAALPAPPFAEVGPQRWSAFVTHDLASVFEDTPWLDIPPTDEGQATILRALAPMSSAAFDAASSRLALTAAAPPDAAPPPSSQPVTATHASDPARFLARVMNDETAPLAARIEAARILLGDAKRP